MSTTPGTVRRLSLATACLFAGTLVGCTQQPVSHVYIQDIGGAAHGAPQVDTSRLPADWVRTVNSDSGMGEGATTEVTVKGGPFRVILVPVTTEPSTVQPQR